ncbi:MAG: ABC transporter permease subunit [Oscillospiraceae bacterium]|nr:ABC transporter permease subunit [Oscillospiraceae bacterium]
MFAILKREFRAYFTSPIGYVFVAVCMLTSGLVFRAEALVYGSADISGVFRFMFVVLMVAVPLLTMRLMAEDKRQKTDQLLLTAPISLNGLVAGKFLAAYVVFLLGIGIIPIYGVVLSFFADVAWVPIWGNFLGIALLGGIYVALGLLISSLTENQMIAAVASIFLNFVISLLNTIVAFIPARFLTDSVVSFFKQVSVYERYVQFTLGIFKVSNLLFFVSIAAVFVFLTARLIDVRRWN